MLARGVACRHLASARVDVWPPDEEPTGGGWEARCVRAVLALSSATCCLVCDEALGDPPGNGAPCQHPLSLAPSRADA